MIHDRKSINNLKLVLRKLESCGFTDIQSIEFNKQDKDIKKTENKNLIFLIDAREEFIFDYGLVKSFVNKNVPPTIFLRYDKVARPKSLVLSENGGFHYLDDKETLHWADSFSFTKAALLETNIYVSLLEKAKDIEEFLDSVLMLAQRGIPVPQWNEQRLKPCLFLDRDGILIEDSGYVGHPKDVILIKDVIPLILWAKQQGWYVIVVSNQSGIARGKFTNSDLHETTEEIKSLLRKYVAEPDGWYYCPFLPKGSVAAYAKNSVSRKPLPGLFLQASMDYPIDFDRSWMVGDKISDCVSLLGMQSCLVKGRYPLPDTAGNVFNNITELLAHISRVAGLGSHPTVK